MPTDPEIHLDAGRVADVMPPEDSGKGNGKDKAKGGKARRSRSGTPRRETGLQGRLEKALTRIAEVVENRGDVELGEIIREDAPAMAGGLVSITRKVRGLRYPLLILLEAVEPLLAFGRVAAALRARFLGWRHRRLQEAEQAAWEAEEAARQAEHDAAAAAAGAPPVAVP